MDLLEVIRSPISWLGAIITSAITGGITYVKVRNQHRLANRRSDLETFDRVTKQWQQIADEYLDRWRKSEDQLSEVRIQLSEQAVLIARQEVEITNLKTELDELRSKLEKSEHA